MDWSLRNMRTISTYSFQLSKFTQDITRYHMSHDLKEVFTPFPGRAGSADGKLVDPSSIAWLSPHPRRAPWVRFTLSHYVVCNDVLCTSGNTWNILELWRCRFEAPPCRSANLDDCPLCLQNLFASELLLCLRVVVSYVSWWQTQGIIQCTNMHRFSFDKFKLPTSKTVRLIFSKTETVKLQTLPSLLCISDCHWVW